MYHVFKIEKKNVFKIGNWWKFLGKNSLTGLSLPVILYYLSFQGETSVVVLIVLCFGVEFLCCLSLMCVFVF